MSGRFTASTEIGSRRNQRLAEMMHPDPIHKHARGERVGGRRYRLGQFQAPAAVAKDARLTAIQHSHKSARHGLRRTGWVAPAKDVRSIWLRKVSHNHGA